MEAGGSNCEGLRGFCPSTVDLRVQMLCTPGTLSAHTAHTSGSTGEASDFFAWSKGTAQRGPSAKLDKVWTNSVQVFPSEDGST